MARAIYAILSFLIVATACTERMVCPAYQSAYIYDKNELRKKFSYFQEDSTPKVFTASKTKYLIAEPTPYRKKLRSLQTVPMKKVNVTVPDSISGVKEDSVITADLDQAARSVMDTTMIVDVPKDTVSATKEDSTYVITVDREVRVLKYNMPDSLVYDSINEKYIPQQARYYIDEVGYNTEQDNYMWYLRRSLILPDVKIAKLQSATKAEEAAKKEKGIGGFFRKLFGKKKTMDIDSAELDVQPEEEEFDFIDTTEQVTPNPAETINGRKRRNKDEVVQEGVEEELPADNEDRKKKRRREEESVSGTPPEQQEQEDNGDGF